MKIQAQGKRFYQKTTCIHNQMQEFTQNKKENLKIGSNDCRILQYISPKRKPTHIKEIAKHMHITQSRFTHISDTLIEKGYIVRLDDEKDRRAYKIKITKKGQNLIKKFNQIHIKAIDEALRELPENELINIAKNLEKWKTFLRTQIKKEK